jgi:hypothetical protein
MRIKKCIKCSEQFETEGGGNICKVCQRKAAKEWYYKQKAEGTLAYQKKQTIRQLPLQNDRWKQLRAVKAQMRLCETREERRIFYGMMFEKIFNDKPLWEYIIRFGDDYVHNKTKISKNNKKQKQEEDGA